MSEHIERMKIEFRDLKQKTEALGSFIHSNPIFKALDDIEQSRMIKQHGFMESYAAVLSSRIWVAQ